MNHSLNDQIRLWETPESVTITFIANIIRIMGIPQRIAGVYGITLDQLDQEGKLKQILHHSSGLGSQANFESQRDIPSRPLLGTINVIFAAPGRIGSCPSRIMSITRLSSGDINQDRKRARVELPLVMGFSDEEKIGTIQPHDNALVITLRIGGYNVKRVMVDQGSAAEIMYPDLYKGLNLKPEDLTPYSSLLVSFKGKIIIPKG